MASKAKNKLVAWGGIGLIVLLVVLIWLLLGGSETHISDGSEGERAEVLVCKTGAVDGGFFYDGSAGETQNEVKMLFVDGKIDKVFYSYRGDFASEGQAESVSATMHAKYDIYFGENNASRSVFTSTFANVANEVRINIYGGYDSLSDATAVFFFLDRDEIESEKEYSMDKLGEFYAKKGFKCEYNNKKDEESIKEEDEKN